MVAVTAITFAIAMAVAAESPSQIPAVLQPRFQIASTNSKWRTPSLIEISIELSEIENPLLTGFSAVEDFLCVDQALNAREIRNGPDEH